LEETLNVVYPVYLMSVSEEVNV